jgi:hypothetical protein
VSAYAEIEYVQAHLDEMEVVKNKVVPGGRIYHREALLG